MILTEKFLSKPLSYSPGAMLLKIISRSLSTSCAWTTQTPIKSEERMRSNFFTGAKLSKGDSVDKSINNRLGEKGWVPSKISFHGQNRGMRNSASVRDSIITTTTAPGAGGMPGLIPKRGNSTP